MKYISLFAGIGGFDLALSRLGHECVWANEWDKYAAQIYNRKLWNKYQATGQTPHTEGASTNIDSNYVERTSKGIDTRDIRTVPTEEIPDHDLLVGGFPCQAFSIAGKRRGFDDTRGTLFFEIARILKDKQPKLFILENVKGLLSHDSGNTFKTIISTLTELGYDLQWQVLNSKNFGVPQNRERVFIVGHLRGEPRPQVFPIGGDNKEDTRIIGEDVAYTIDSNYHKGTNTLEKSRRSVVQVNNPTHSNDRVYDECGGYPTLNTMQGGRRQPKIIRTPLKFLKRNQKNIDGDYSFTIDSANTGGVSDGVKVRRLTPLECERLQGFPDGWTEGISDTQRYKCLGNAVTVNVVYEIAKRL